MKTNLVKLILLCCALSGCSSSQQAQAPPMTMPPVPVSIADAVEEAVPIQIQAVGNVEPFSSVEVKSQVAGPLMSVRFTEGANVNQGDLLFEIDPRPYRESLRQAEAAVTRDLAQLRQAEANLARDQAQLKNAQADAARFEQLAREGITPRIQEQQIRTAAEMAVQSVRASEAAIEGIRASLESNRAAVDRAKLDLSYCEVRAPISGRAGNLLLNAGNLVKANDEALVVINRVTPIFVSFGVPERYLADVKQKSVGRKLPIQAAVNKDSGEASLGSLNVIDNTIDPNTGTIRLKGQFDNRDGKLWPGQFVNVVLELEQQVSIVIPAEAVQAGQQGPFVYVVKADKTVEPRPVSTGQTVSGKIIIEKGIAAGETVVTDGQSRLYPGAAIVAQAKGS